MKTRTYFLPLSPYLLQIDEMALRDNSSHLLSEIILRLEQEGSDTSAFTSVIEHMFIPSLRDGLRNKTEVSINNSELQIIERFLQ